MTLVYAQCVYIVKEKYQIDTSKAVVGIDWPVHALSQYKHNHFIKSHLELQREILLTPLLLFIKSICLVDINMFSRFDEIPAMTIQDIKETSRYGLTT